MEDELIQSRVMGSDCRYIRNVLKSRPGKTHLVLALISSPIEIVILDSKVEVAVEDGQTMLGFLSLDCSQTVGWEVLSV